MTDQDRGYYAMTDVPSRIQAGAGFGVTDRQDGDRSIGTANYLGLFTFGKVMTSVFSLEVHGRKLLGTWASQGREFVRLDPTASDG